MSRHFLLWLTKPYQYQANQQRNFGEFLKTTAVREPTKGFYDDVQ